MLPDNLFDQTSKAFINQLLIYVWRQKLPLQTMLLHWNPLTTLTSPHALQSASQMCHQNASLLPSKLCNSGANSTSHWFYLNLSKFFFSAPFFSFPKGISYMANPFLYTFLFYDFLYSQLGFSLFPMNFLWDSNPCQSCSADEHHLHLKKSCWFDNHFLLLLILSVHK